MSPKINLVLLDRPARAHAASEVLARHRSKYLGENEPEDRHGANRCYRQPSSCKGRHRPKPKAEPSTTRTIERPSAASPPAKKADQLMAGVAHPGRAARAGADIDASPPCAPPQNIKRRRMMPGIGTPRTQSRISLPMSAAPVLDWPVSCLKRTGRRAFPNQGGSGPIVPPPRPPIGRIRTYLPLAQKEDYARRPCLPRSSRLFSAFSLR